MKLESVRMSQRQMRSRGVARARAVEQERAPWALAMLVAAGVLGLGISLVHAQPSAVPEVVRPRTDSPTIPPSGSDRAPVTPPRSENPLADSGTARPIPDTGVIAPPSTGSTPVIQPPATGTMPVIPPPTTSGGERIVPK